MQGYQGYGDVVARQGGAPQVDPGGYACFIAAVEDGSAEPNPYIGLTLNPIDPKTNKYMVTDREELSDPERSWRYTYRFFIGEYGGGGIDWGRMKALTEAVEQTTQNKGFTYDGTKDGAEQTLVGKFVGCVFKRVGYVRKSGKHAGELRRGHPARRRDHRRQGPLGRLPAQVGGAQGREDGGGEGRHRAAGAAGDPAARRAAPARPRRGGHPVLGRKVVRTCQTS